MMIVGEVGSIMIEIQIDDGVRAGGVTSSVVVARIEADRSVNPKSTGGSRVQGGIFCCLFLSVSRPPSTLSSN